MSDTDDAARNVRRDAKRSAANLPGALKSRLLLMTAPPEKTRQEGIASSHPRLLGDGVSVA